MQIQQLTEIICSQPEIFLEEFGIEESINNEKISTFCLVHGGDNPHALSISFNNHYDLCGSWACWTRNCHKIFKPTLIGLVRGLLSSRYCNWSKPGDQIYPWGKTLKFLEGLYGLSDQINYTPRQYTYEKPIKKLPVRQDRIIMTKKKFLFYNKDISEYFIRRGFSEAVLRKYDVRSCNNPATPFFKRSLLPVYDEKNNVIGISGRTEIDKEPKWLYTKKFPCSTNLFNLNNATEYIKKLRSCILVESPLNIFRLEEAGIHNAVCIWSAGGFNEYKKYLLDKLGVAKIVLALDNDPAGIIGSQNIHKRYDSLYNIVDISLPNKINDVADLSVKECKEIFKDYR